MNDDRDIRTMLKRALPDEEVPLPPNLAERVIERAAQRKRRRAAMAGSAAVLALAVVAFFLPRGRTSPIEWPDRDDSVYQSIATVSRGDLEELGRQAAEQERLVSRLRRSRDLIDSELEEEALRRATGSMFNPCSVEYEAAARMAMSYADSLALDAGKREAAHEEAMRISSLFPGTTAARLAALRN